GGARRPQRGALRAPVRAHERRAGHRQQAPHGGHAGRGGRPGGPRRRPARAGGAAAPVPAAGGMRRPGAGRRPNVPLTIPDAPRQGAIRACGDRTVRTPVLDRLIAAGTSFERTYHYGGPVAAVCVPARTCLLTGVTPFRSSLSAAGDFPGAKTIRP